MSIKLVNWLKSIMAGSYFALFTLLLLDHHYVRDPCGGVMTFFILLQILDHVPEGVQCHGKTYERFHLDTCPGMRPHQTPGLNRTL